MASDDKFEGAQKNPRKNRDGGADRRRNVDSKEKMERERGWRDYWA